MEGWLRCVVRAPPPSIPFFHTFCHRGEGEHYLIWYRPAQEGRKGGENIQKCIQHPLGVVPRESSKQDAMSKISLRNQKRGGKEGRTCRLGCHVYYPPLSSSFPYLK